MYRGVVRLGIWEHRGLSISRSIPIRKENEWLRGEGRDGHD